MTTETTSDPTLQDQINRAEWSDLDNWSHPTFGLYFSRRDTRMWVPKRTPSWGWTINMGHPSSVAWIVGIVLVPMLIVAAVLGRKSR